MVEQLTPNAVAEHFDSTRQAVSRHIRILTECKVLTQEKVGRELKVLIDKKEAGRYLGRTEFDSVEVDNEVVIHSQKKLNIGEFYKVKITKAYDYDIEGEIVDNS